jgi:hypothetical protein
MALKNLKSLGATLCGLSMVYRRSSKLVGALGTGIGFRSAANAGTAQTTAIKMGRRRKGLKNATVTFVSSAFCWREYDLRLQFRSLQAASSCRRKAAAAHTTAKKYSSSFPVHFGLRRAEPRHGK